MRNSDLSPGQEEKFISDLVAFFHPIVVRWFSEGRPWWEVADGLKATLDEKAVWRLDTGNVHGPRRAAALRGFRNRIHPRVIEELRKLFPSAESN